ncbi:MAG: hypothetical protein PVI44_03960 [Balneolaceae bacterium]
MNFAALLQAGSKQIISISYGFQTAYIRLEEEIKIGSLAKKSMGYTKIVKLNIRY